MARKTTSWTDPFDDADDVQFRLRLNTAIWNHLPGDDGQPMRKRLSVLRHHERLFLSVDIFDSETFNDGIEHFFFYDCGDLLEFTLDGLSEIGVGDVAARARRYAETVFSKDFPLDAETRQLILSRDKELAEQAEQEFGPYFDASGVVGRCLVAWARANREQFRITPPADPNGGGRTHR